MASEQEQSSTFGGIPFVVNEYVPDGELWLISEGKRVTVHAHEGPQSGEDIEVWIRKPKIIRIVNIGESWRIR